MSIIRQDYGNLADMATQQLLAPIFPTLVATKAISKGGLFIINNTLYKAKTDIAQDAQIVVGTNAELASTIAEELDHDDSYSFDVNNIDSTPFNATSSNMYTCPSDGYIRMTVKKAPSWGSTTLGDIRTTDANLIYRALNYSTTYSSLSTFFVRKGLKLYPNSADIDALTFIPIKKN